MPFDSEGHWTPLESPFGRADRIYQSSRVTASPINSNLNSSPSPVSVISVSPSPSAQSSRASLLSTAHSSDSASDLHADMAKLFRKQRGYFKRFEEWKKTSHLFTGDSTDLVITHRLCTFYAIELMQYRHTQSIKLRNYKEQLHSLNTPTQHGSMFHDFIALCYDYPYLADVSQLVSQVERADHDELVQRSSHLQRIIQQIQTDLVKLHQLLDRINPFMHYNSNPYSPQARTLTQLASVVSPVPVHFAAIPVPVVARSGIPAYAPTVCGGGGGGGGSGSDTNSSTCSRVIRPNAADYCHTSNSPSSNSSRSTSPSIPPLPPLTTPSDPTHLEAYPTSHNTSTVIDNFITNPFTLSGTFSLTLTPNNSTTNVTLSQPLITGAGQMTAIGTPLLSSEFGWDRPPPEDSNANPEEHERTAYEYGQTDEPDQSTDSDSADTHASSSAADSSPVDNSHEEYIDWLSNGCPDSDTDYIPDSD